MGEVEDTYYDKIKIQISSMVCLSFFNVVVCLDSDRHHDSKRDIAESKL